MNWRVSGPMVVPVARRGDAHRLPNPHPHPVETEARALPAARCTAAREAVRA